MFPFSNLYLGKGTFYTVHKIHIYEVVADLGVSGATPPAPALESHLLCSGGNLEKLPPTLPQVAASQTWTGNATQYKELLKSCLTKLRWSSPKSSARQGKCPYRHMLYMEPPEKPEVIGDWLFRQSTGISHHQRFLLRISNFNPIVFLVSLNHRTSPAGKYAVQAMPFSDLCTSNCCLNLGKKMYGEGS